MKFKWLSNLLLHFKKDKDDIVKFYINNKYLVKLDWGLYGITDEAKEKLLLGEFVEGIDWIKYDGNPPPEGFEDATLF